MLKLPQILGNIGLDIDLRICVGRRYHFFALEFRGDLKERIGCGKGRILETAFVGERDTAGI